MPRHLPKPTMIEIVAPIVMRLMEKAAKAAKTKRAEADLAAHSMAVDGLGDHVGYRMPQGMKLNLYLTSVVVWLILLKTPTWHR